MSVVTCPDCDAKLKLKAALAPGKKITCPKCSKSFVPEPPDEAAAGITSAPKGAHGVPVRSNATRRTTIGHAGAAARPRTMRMPMPKARAMTGQRARARKSGRA